MELPHDEALTWLVTHYARLLAAHGEAFREPVLLEPTGKHFPDPFERDAASVDRLLRRMIGYAPLHDDLGLALRFLEPDEPATGGGCGTGGCGTGACAPGEKKETARGVVEIDDGYIVDVNVSDVGHATLLTSSLARSVGSLILAEAEEDVLAEELVPVSEMAALASGFGVLLLEGAHIYGKSCGGVRVHQATSLGVMELAVALGLFVRVNDLRPGAARAHLSVTQAEAFDKAMEWVDSNPEIVRGLKEHPETLAEGLFTLEPVRGFFGRLFGKKSEPLPDFTKAAPKKKVRTPEEQRKHDEIRALVDEAFGDR